MVIATYDPLWPSQFDAAATELHQALGEWAVDIEHIGSTAVPGLAAKPIIDIQIGVSELASFRAHLPAIEALGYTYVPDYEAQFPNRRYLRRRAASGVTTHQLHLVERTDPDWWDRHIAFRDWLRRHPDDRQRYEQLKQTFAATYRTDRERYTDEKSEFIDTIVHRALAS